MDTSGITLASNEADLVDPVPDVATPDIGPSTFTVLENDGTPLSELADEVVVELDPSEFSIKDNDGTTIVEHHDEHIPEVAVPNFDLNEPRPLRENMAEKKELLNSSTRGITLAMAGVDLPQDESPPSPALGVPDASEISLLPNFDV